MDYAKNALADMWRGVKSDSTIFQFRFTENPV